MRNANLFLGMIGILALTACATEKPKPVWKVKTSTESSGTKIWVTKADGSVQCAPKAKGVLSPGLAAQQLKSAGVMVFDARSGRDGQMHGQKCGAPTGSTVDVEISRPDLSAALSQGFVTKGTASE